MGYGCHGQGRALHEFIHALGFIHEHQREDRNEHIKINWENIKEKHKVDFHKTPLGEYQDNLLGYDVNSIMHYGAKAFAKNEGQNTIKFLDDKVFTGQRLRPTTKDMQGICTAYGCDKSCGKEVKTCDNKKEEYFVTVENLYFFTFLLILTFKLLYIAVEVKWLFKKRYLCHIKCFLRRCS